MTRASWVSRDFLVFALAFLLAALLTSRHAGSWNDGSRLATVECLVDHGTWAIDDSIFVRVQQIEPGKQTPYPSDDLLLSGRGTADKLWIDGHFYSDKSPVPAVLMAIEYGLIKALTGLRASLTPELFCWLLSLLSSGLAYALAVWSLYQLGEPLGLSPSLRLGLTASFAFATIALPYAGYANNHILLLAVSVRLLTELTWLGRAPSYQTKTRLFILGSLAGLGYGIDLGAGPIFALGTLVMVIYRCRSWAKVALFIASAFPWWVLHHALNYVIGGSWKPANAIVSYFDWPGCPFNADNMTGVWHHEGPLDFVLYALDLLVGKKGFLFHNLPLLLALTGTWLLLRRSQRERPEICLSIFWFLGIWLAYSATSNNASGVCCSVRWFVPLLGPGYLLLAILCRDYPKYQGNLVLLSFWGTVMTGIMTYYGAWMPHMVPGYWLILSAALLHWGWHSRHRKQGEHPPLTSGSGNERRIAALASRIRCITNRDTPLNELSQAITADPDAN